MIPGHGQIEKRQIQILLGLVQSIIDQGQMVFGKGQVKRHQVQMAFGQVYDEKGNLFRKGYLLISNLAHQNQLAAHFQPLTPFSRTCYGVNVDAAADRTQPVVAAIPEN